MRLTFTCVLLTYLKATEPAHIEFERRLAEAIIPHDRD
jgi:hypothetical protein